MNFGAETGWTGVFTRNQAEGAIPNGGRIVKLQGEPRDSHPPGTQGVVLGSIACDDEVRADAQRRGLRPPDAYFYFVEWDPRPHVAVGVVDWKIARASA